MSIDIPPSSIKTYIENIKPQFRDAVIKNICEGEALINVFETAQGNTLLKIVSEKITREIDEMLGMIRIGKYDTTEELERIRKSCIKINGLTEMVIDWGTRLNALERHLEKFQ